ncbi:MAG: hypothetical protein WA817_12145 [Candidatus Acidiferrum sp.]
MRRLLLLVVLLLVPAAWADSYAFADGHAATNPNNGNPANVYFRSVVVAYTITAGVPGTNTFTLNSGSGTFSIDNMASWHAQTIQSLNYSYITSLGVRVPATGYTGVGVNGNFSYPNDATAFTIFWYNGSFSYYTNPVSLTLVAMPATTPNAGKIQASWTNSNPSRDMHVYLSNGVDVLVPAGQTVGAFYVPATDGKLYYQMVYLNTANVYNGDTGTWSLQDSAGTNTTLSSGAILPTAANTGYVNADGTTAVPSPSNAAIPWQTSTDPNVVNRQGFDQLNMTLQQLLAKPSGGGGTTSIDLSPVTSRQDTQQATLMNINGHLVNIENGLTQGADIPSVDPMPTTPLSERTFGEMSAALESIVPAPLSVSEAMGAAHSVDIDVPIPCTSAHFQKTVDFSSSSYATPIAIFRGVLLTVLTIAFWFLAVKTIRGAFADQS